MCAVLQEAVSGSSYAFSVYAPQLQKSLGFTEAQIQNAGSVGNIGLYISIVAGAAYDRAGPVVTTWVGATLSAAGYALLYLAAAGHITATPGLVALYTFLWSHGSSWLDTAAVSTAIKNSSADSRGLNVGLLKSLFGLSASLLTLTYTSIYKPDVLAFLRFLAILIPVVAVLCSTGLRLLPPAEAAQPYTPREKLKVTAAMVAVLSTAAYLAAVGLLQNSGVLGVQPALAYVLLPLIGLQALLLIPVNGSGSKKAADGEEDEAEAEAGSGGGGGATQLLLSTTSSGVSAGSSSLNAADDHDHDYDGHPAKKGDVASSGVPPMSGATFVEGVLSLDFFLILLVLFAGTGSGLTIINNLGNLATALGAAKDGQDVYVVLLSVSNCVGRLAMGTLSDVFASRLIRPGFLTIAVLSMAGATALLSASNLTSLYAGSIWVGASYGAFWSVGPPLVADRFGARAFAAIYSLSSISTAIASYALSAGLAASVFDAHSHDGGATCLGIACYQTTFIVLSALCGVGTLAGLMLTRRLRPLYNDKGQARRYVEVAELFAPSALARLAQRTLLPLCCCRCGRGFLVVEEGEEEGDGDVILH